jgi:S1-C subfamily serine protease
VAGWREAEKMAGNLEAVHVLRTLLGTILLALTWPASGQVPSVLHVKVMLVDAAGKLAPVPRHALLVSDNPATRPPRKIVTGLDGTVDLTLGPGSYTVESEVPVVIEGTAYQWTQTLEIAAGQNATLELTAGNAEVVVPSAASTPVGKPDNFPSFLLDRWQGSVFALWTPISRASGFLVDNRGLVATSQRALGNAKSVEVQITPALKVAARVLAADPVRDVAVLWVDPNAVASLPAMPLQCAQATKPVADRQAIFTIGAPLRNPKGMGSGKATVVPHAILADLYLDAGSTGGPVFTEAGAIVGITGVVGETGDGRRGDSSVVPIAAACDVLKVAEAAMRQASPPSGAPLPVEPVQPFPLETLQDAARRRGSGVSPYRMSSADFDIAFITPVVAYAAAHRADEAGARDRSRTATSPASVQDRIRLLTEFANWSEYVADSPPVLLVRVTPRLVEGFWKMVARGAAQTQGVSLPPLKAFKAGFWQMRAFCGAGEVTPIHPFELEQRLSDTVVVREGLYVFDPGAIGPQCGAVKLVLYSEKNPAKGDTRIVDPKLLQQVWDDFAPYREPKTQN